MIILMYGVKNYCSKSWMNDLMRNLWPINAINGPIATKFFATKLNLKEITFTALLNGFFAGDLHSLGTGYCSHVYTFFFKFSHTLKIISDEFLHY